jgi:hypothetical protein
VIICVEVILFHKKSDLVKNTKSESVLIKTKEEILHSGKKDAVES